MTDTLAPRTEAPERLLLPERPPRLGPYSRNRLLRLAAVLLVIEAVGLWMALTGSPGTRAAGASMVFPGAGFLYVASPLLFLVTLFLLLVALVLWWGASVHLAIPTVWLAGVLVPAALADGPRLLVDRGTVWGWATPVALVLAVVSVAVAVYRVDRRYREKLAKVPELNAYLATAEVVAPSREPRHADAMDVDLLRWVYAIAHQPDDGLDGLDWGDQFHSGTQLRYQLNALCWGLSVFAANFVPNAVGQMERTIASLIQKHTDLRVWSYWRTLNIAGNFDPDPDPIRRDNIMFSAFLGDVLNVFEAATGSARFDEPGSLTFVWKDGRTFPYDHHTIAEAVRRNYERSKLGFFPCEPGWSFTVCNVMGAQSLRGHDTLHGTASWDEVRPKWVRALEEEYLTPDGSYAHIRSNHLGLSWDTGEVPGGHYLAAGSNRFADILPSHAWRASALEQYAGEKKIKGLAMAVKDGVLALELPAALERHRARSSALGAWNSVIGGAQKFGQRDLYLAALDASARQCATGDVWPDRPMDASVNAIGGHMIVRWSTPLGTADLSIRGHVPPAGPVLDSAGWREVLVTEARSADGVSLDLRLRPLDSRADVVMRFSALRPGAGYVLRGEGVELVVTAGADGTAEIGFHVDRPAVLALLPTGESA